MSNAKMLDPDLCFKFFILATQRRDLVWNECVYKECTKYTTFIPDLDIEVFFTCGENYHKLEVRPKPIQHITEVVPTTSRLYTVLHDCIRDMHASMSTAILQDLTDYTLKYECRCEQFDKAVAAFKELTSTDK